MSALQFCPSCGTKNEPVNGKPANFCSGCGYNLKSLAAFGATPAPAPRPAAQPRPGRTPVVDLTIEDDTVETEEGAISKADVEIIVPQSNVTKVSDLLGTASGGSDGSRQPLSSKTGKRRAGKSVFTKFQDEAGKGGTKGQEIG